MPKSKSKAKTTKKGSKNTLSRGRAKRDPRAVTDDTTSDSDVSEFPSSPESKKPDINSSASSSKSSTVVTKKTKAKKVDEDEFDSDSDTDLEWQTYPSLTDGLRTDKFPYITESVKFRQFELEERRALLQMRDEMEMFRDGFNSAIKLTKNLCPGYEKMKLADVMPMFGFPKTFEDLVLKLVRLGSKVNLPDYHTNLGQGQGACGNDPFESVFEESQDSLTDLFTPVAKLRNLPAVFPSPAKMSKYTTPQNNGIGSVFQFGSKTGPLSTSKAPRPAKPGEVVIAYSKAGSPIMQRRIPDNGSRMERVEWIEPDGSKVEVDLVFRGGNDPSKLSRFNFFQERVQGIAASMSTIKQNRILPPRINPKGTTQSAKKKTKPEWR